MKPLERGPGVDEMRESGPLYESFVETTVTYTLEMDGKLFVIENVPARVDIETGEQFFSPGTVERLQEIIQGGMEPLRGVEAPEF